MTKHDIIEKYLGTPYSKNNDSENGLNCWGLVINIYADLGHKIYDVGELIERKEIENYHQEWEKVMFPDLFDVIGIKNATGEALYHAGVYLGKNEFIHTSKVGTIISRVTEPRWKKRIDGYFHLKERDA